MNKGRNKIDFFDDFISILNDAIRRIHSPKGGERIYGGAFADHGSGVQNGIASDVSAVAEESSHLS